MLHFPVPAGNNFMFCIILDLSGINQPAAPSSPPRGAVAFRLRVRLSSDFFLCPRIDGARDIRKDERKGGRARRRRGQGGQISSAGLRATEVFCFVIERSSQIRSPGNIAVDRRWRCA